MISVIGIFIFLYVLARILIDKIPVTGNYWAQPEFFSYIEDDMAVTSLEWSQNSPPVLHTYNELPYVVGTLSAPMSSRITAN